MPVPRRLQFVELRADGEATDVGYAPYLDYRAATADEVKVASAVLDAHWMGPEAENAGVRYAVEKIVPAHLDEVRRRTLDRIARTRDVVRQRLTHEITYWDRRAQELKDQELAGRHHGSTPPKRLSAPTHSRSV